ncbi:MAG: FHA domain-containing protein [Pseudobdellovibrionaceae bacterium]
MWGLRILTGPQAGQVVELKMGKNLIGRGPQCSIKLSSPGVSKEHTELTVFSDRLMVTDLKSSNGTFLNGIRIQSGLVRLGDKISIHDILVDVVPAPEVRASRPESRTPQTGYHHQPAVGLAHSQAHEHVQAQGQMHVPAPAYQQGGLKGFTDRAHEYLDRVALPGVYKLPQLVEFKFVLLGFVVLFIFLTTLLSMIPMVQITRASIIAESKRRAASIARTVATLNQAALLQNSYSTLSTNSAEAEDGVKQVLIVQQSDGMILAPATRAGSTPDLPFVHSARREMRSQTVEVDSSTIGASFPIGLFDPNTGEQSVKAHAIVLYDIGSLAFDDGRAISLFMQTLVIASIVGLLIYFFMYKLIEYPIVSLNKQLDIAMREKKDTTEVNFLFPSFQALVGNINSLLTRYIHGEKDSGSPGAAGFINKDGEAENLVQIVGFPCVAISKEGRIIASNSAFTQVSRAEASELHGQMFNVIPDVALQKNIEGLLARSRQSPGSIHNDNLEFSGHLCVLNCQAVSSNGHEPDYFIITVSPTEGGAS